MSNQPLNIPLQPTVKKLRFLPSAELAPLGGYMHLRIKDDQPSGEFGARIFHVVFGVICACAAIWVLFSVSPFNPFAFFIPLLLGLGPLLVGLYGDRKTVFQLLFISGS